MKTFTQNITIAEQILKKIAKHHSTDLDPLKVIEELTVEEMKEFFLYLIHHPENKEFSEYPDSKIFPKILAFYRMHPRESSGAQEDTLSLFWDRYFATYSDETKNRIS